VVGWKAWLLEDLLMGRKNGRWQGGSYTFSQATLQLISARDLVLNWG